MKIRIQFFKGLAKSTLSLLSNYSFSLEKAIAKESIFLIRQKDEKMKKVYLICLMAVFTFFSKQAYTQCTTEAGTLLPENHNGCIYWGYISVLSNNDEVLEADDVLKYIVHDGSATDIGSNYQFYNSSILSPPSFAQAGVTYQVAIAAGNPDGMGGIDFSDPCFSFNGGVTVTWHAPPSTNLADIEIGCDEYHVDLFIEVDPPVGNYSFNTYAEYSNDDFTSFSQTVSFTNPGSFIIQVGDQLSGCYSYDTIQVTIENGKPEVIIDELLGGSCGALNVTAEVINGISPISFEWSNGGNEPTNILSPGTHCVSITSGNGCVAENCIVVPEPGDFDVSLSFVQSETCESSRLEAEVTGDAGNYNYHWSSGTSTTYFNNQFEPGQNYVTVTDGSGCEQIASVFVDEAPSLCGELQLRLFGDFNNDCVFGSSDQLLPKFKAIITDENGIQHLAVTSSGIPFQNYNWSRKLNPGNYTLTVETPNSLWVPCYASQDFILTAGGTTLVDVPLQAIEICPDLTVNVSVAELNWCNPNNVVGIVYENFGTQTATDAYVDFQMEEFLSITSSPLPFIELGNHLYRFELGDVNIGESVNFYIAVLVDCEASLGATHCLEAEIFPNEPCVVNQNWSGASVEIVDAICANDSLSFFVENVGSAAMTAELEYVIIEDAIMLLPSPNILPPLTPSDQHEIKVPANGATWRLETSQEPNHPGINIPSLSVEGCSTFGSMGFINQFPQNDADPFVDIECIENTSSYDPNDKQGYPLGIGEDHIIRPGQPIEYRVRFQNTGTDTAETVVIRDTISEWLDPMSIELGAASHSYRFEHYGEGLNQLAFVFENINLLDSNLNEAASHGFIDFKIWPREEAPLGTDIFNSAAIYFDYNPPIYTNTTHHRIDNPFLTGVNFVSPLFYEISIIPNPISEQAMIKIEGVSLKYPITLSLFDVLGKKVWTKQTTTGEVILQRNDLAAGLYFLQVTSGGKLIGKGKIQAK